MASDINRVLLVGRLTRDPELKSTSTGTVFCRFSLASNRTYYRKEGDPKEEVGFFDCVAWGKPAEIIHKYLSKGRRMGVDGWLRWSQWENTEGKKQSRVEITVENFQFLDPKAGGGGEVYSSEPIPPPPPPQESTSEAVGSSQDILNEDDIPF